jgi:drug/metabolite transporter (DMT)-like permease
MFTLGFGALLLDEPINALQLCGVALVLAGVMLVSRGARSPRKATA